MAFKDYYRLLDVPPSATSAEVRAAYRRQSLRWHPDHNEGRDTTQQMQDINEAYSILKDEEKRRRYDAEYACFHQQQSQSSCQQEAAAEGAAEDFDYEVRDEELRQDIYAARKHAAEYVEELKRSLHQDISVAANAVWEEVKGSLIAGLIMTVIGLLLLAFMD